MNFSVKHAPREELPPQELTAWCCLVSVRSRWLTGVDLINTAVLTTWRAPKNPAVSLHYA